jgi:hypothetical protein
MGHLLSTLSRNKRARELVVVVSVALYFYRRSIIEATMKDRLSDKISKNSRGQQDDHRAAEHAQVMSQQAITEAHKARRDASELLAKQAAEHCLMRRDLVEIQTALAQVQQSLGGLSSTVVQVRHQMAEQQLAKDCEMASRLVALETRWRGEENRRQLELKTIQMQVELRNSANEEVKGTKRLFERQMAHLLARLEQQESDRSPSGYLMRDRTKVDERAKKAEPSGGGMLTPPLGDLDEVFFTAKKPLTNTWNTPIQYPLSPTMGVFEKVCVSAVPLQRRLRGALIRAQPRRGAGITSAVGTSV